MSLKGKVIVVTGASSGFGELIARRCVAAGASVVLAARTEPKLAQLVAELGASRALAVPTDVSRQDDVQRLAQATLQRFGHVDVLINNAGFGVLDSFLEARLEDLQAMVEVNLYGAVRCTKAFLPHMLARRSGQIVMMASIAGLVSTSKMGFYSTTKAALVGLSRTLMQELSGSGVRCALICPGVAPTGFQQISGEDKYARSTRLTACTPQQVADATIRAIARRTQGEVVVPALITPLVRLAGLLPRLTRLVLRVLG